MSASDLAVFKGMYQCDMGDFDYAEAHIRELQRNVLSNLFHNPAGIPSCSCRLFGGIDHELPVLFDVMRKGARGRSGILNTVVSRCPHLAPLAFDIADQVYFQGMPERLAAVHLDRDVTKLKKLVRWRADKIKRGAWR